MHEALRQFHPVIGKWFEERVGVPAPPQVLGWPVIGAGKSALILAPTGSGKTLAAFLSGIDWLARRLVAGKESAGVQILYVSPLKALANDVRKNLLKPLEELGEAAAEMGEADWPEIHVAVRTGDTPQRERAAMIRRPPHILITTPESLNLMLTTGARGIFAGVRFVIVDEVHALAGSKRGVFLSLVLERLEEERRRNDAARMTNDETGKRRRGVKIAPGVFAESEPVRDLIRIGLSATARPEERIARWLAGFDEHGQPRAIEIVKTGQRKRLDLGVICPFDAGGDHSDSDPGLAADRRSAGAGDAPEKTVKGAGHWPEVSHAILELIRTHRSTLVFGNSRQLVERLAARLEEEIAGETDAATRRNGDAANGEEIENRKLKIENAPHRVPVILPHHGSIAREVRLETEQALKRGEVDAVLATSSLELGIDIGALDLVVQIDSPGSISAGLQRVGRAGHLEKATAKGRFVARGSHELPAFGALLPLMETGEVEETHVPENCLDVLAQQIVAACVGRPQKRRELFGIFRRAMPYRRLPEKQFDAVVAMLSRRSERVGALGAGVGLRPRISFDRVNDELTIMPGTAQMVLVNSGVIADTGQFGVYLIGTGETANGRSGEPASALGPAENRKSKIENRKSPGVRLGELDEEFVYETKEGDRIILGSHTWRVVRIDADRVWVKRAEPGASRMPFWRGERAPRSEMLGEAVARFHGEMVRRLTESAGGRTGETANYLDPIKNQNSKIENVQEWLMREHRFDAQAADNAIYYYRRQLEKSAVPTETQIVVEHFVDRTGEPLIAILSPLGSRVNYALRLALESHFARRRLPAQIVHNDDGILIRPPAEVAGGGEVPENPLAWLKARSLESEIADQMESAALFGLRFRQNAARALMLPKMTLSQRTPLWQQRLRARHLLATVKRERNFPIILETYRECMQDVLAIPGVKSLLEKIERGEMMVRTVRGREPGVSSPFARSLFSQFTAAYLYEWDDPLAAGAIEPAVDQSALDEILRGRGGENDAATGRHGEAAIEPSWNAEDERALSRRILGADFPARSAEELLEKIEAAGAAGIGFGDADDPRWADWTVGGKVEAQRMLAGLQKKRRLLRVQVCGAGKKSPAVWRWIAVDNFAIFLAAAGRRPRIEKTAYADLPEAILHTEIPADEARKIVAEQSLRQKAVSSREDFLAELSWIKSARAILEGFIREGKVRVIAAAGGVSSAAKERAGQGILWADHADHLHAVALRRERRIVSAADLPALQRHLLQWQRIAPALPATAQLAVAENAPADALEDVLDQLTGLAFPLEFWEYEILPARLRGFSPAHLDALFSGGGHWTFAGAGEPGSGQIAFWPRHLLAQRKPPAAAPHELPPDARRIADFLRERGASFGLDIQLGLSMDEPQFATGMFELIFSGGEPAVSNDQLPSLREILRLCSLSESQQRTAARRIAFSPLRIGGGGWRPGGRSAGRARMATGNLGGRWYLLPSIAAAASPTSALENAQQAADRVERFLRRTGFACRELLEPEIDGSWKNAYDVLTRMEWAGTVRRGYFVDGIAGAQFASPGLRLDPPESGSGRNGEAAKGHDVYWLSMLDPANIFARTSGHWVTDSGAEARIPRIAGSWLALIEGRPVLAAISWGQRLIPLPASEEDQHRALATLSTLLNRFPRQAHPFIAVRYWDQNEILGTPAEEILRTQDFTRDTQGMRLYRSYATA